MLKRHFTVTFILIILLNSRLSMVKCHPHSQRILIHGHEWIVPDEPGWEDVVQKADSIRRQWLSNCMTTKDCRSAAERLRQVFLKHPVSSAYYDESIENNRPTNDESSIFKWG